MDKKTSLRLKSKQIRSNLDINKISNILTEKIRELDVYKQAQNIMLYYPLENEINLTGLLHDKKNFYLPRMNGKNLECCPYKYGDVLKKAKYNILEPFSECILCPVLDLVITPALCADRKGNRLGYGGGFYDRFLKTGDWKTLLALPHELLFDEIPSEELDVKINYIVTEKEVCIII